MSRTRALWLGLLALVAVVTTAILPAAAQQPKPNILFIMGDDIGWMQPSIYHRGLMVGETPNIDRIGNEGAMFTHYYAEQSCTAGRTAFITGMQPVRVGMVLPEIPGSPSYLRPGTPHLAKFLLDLGYSTGEFGKNHLGDHTDSLPTAHGFQEYWGYLYHLDAMQGVSFPDINKTPTQQTLAPPCKNSLIPGVPEVPGAVDPKTTVCLTPPRPVLACRSSDGTGANQTCRDEGPLTLERSKTVDEEISAKVVDFLDRNDPRRTNKPFFVWYNPARMHITTVLPDRYLAMVGEPGGKDWIARDHVLRLTLRVTDDLGRDLVDVSAGRSVPRSGQLAFFSSTNWRFGTDSVTLYGPTPGGGCSVRFLQGVSAPGTRPIKPHRQHVRKRPVRRLRQLDRDIASLVVGRRCPLISSITTCPRRCNPDAPIDNPR